LAHQNYLSGADPRHSSRLRHGSLFRVLAHQRSGGLADGKVAAGEIGSWHEPVAAAHHPVPCRQPLERTGQSRGQVQP